MSVAEGREIEKEREQERERWGPQQKRIKDVHGEKRENVRKRER